MAEATSYPVAGRIGPQLSVRLLDAVRQLLGHMAVAYQRPEPDTRTVQVYAEALVEPRRPGQAPRAPRLDAFPFAAQLLTRERQTFPPPAIVVEYVGRATRQLYEQEAATDTNRLRGRAGRVSGDHAGCHVCGAQYVEHENGRVYITHDPQKHGWSDA
jgi:hypothetical protein